MTTHDQNIGNQTFPSFRADLNNALAALFGLSASDTAPSTTVADMLWHDTANNIFKQRNTADSGWIHLWADDKQGFVDQSGSTIYAADSVGTDSYAITLTPAPTAYVAGQVFRVKVGTANTGAATLNVNTLGAVTIKKNYNEDLETGDLVANQIIEVVYDGTNFQLLSTPVITIPDQPKIVQVVGSSVISGSSTTSTTDVDVTGASLAITPASSSNKILVLASWEFTSPIVTGVNVRGYHQVLRGATNISGTDNFICGTEDSDGGNRSYGSHAFTYLDSPATTSEVTYKLQHHTSNSSGTLTTSRVTFVLIEVSA